MSRNEKWRLQIDNIRLKTSQETRLSGIKACSCLESSPLRRRNCNTWRKSDEEGDEGRGVRGMEVKSRKKALAKDDVATSYAPIGGSGRKPKTLLPMYKKTDIDPFATPMKRRVGLDSVKVSLNSSDYK